MKVYQVVFEYFFGCDSGYGTVRTQTGGVFSSIDLCLEDFKFQTESKHIDVKSWIVKEFTLDKRTDSTGVHNIVVKCN